MAEYEVGPFDSEHLYLQWGGSLPGGEIWSCSLRMANRTAPLPVADIDQAYVDQLGTIVGTFHGALLTGIHAAAIMTYCKVNVIGVDGHYKYGTTHEYQPIGIPGGAGSGGVLPPNQITLAVSTMTDYTRGPAHRGRFFIPLPAVPVQQVDGRITAGAAQEVKTSAYNMYNALNVASPNFISAVFSRKAGAPAHRTITDIAVGRVLDTQRRRRNALAEAYA